MSDPSRPHVDENASMGITFNGVIPAKESNNIVESPIMNPPTMLQTSPMTVIPPLVPEGTRRHGWVIKTGCDWDNIPNSEASVSAKQVA